MEDDADSCIFCDEPLDREDPANEVRTVCEKAIASIKATSNRKGDQTFLKLEGLTTLDTHKSCYDAYVDEGTPVAERSPETSLDGTDHSAETPQLADTQSSEEQDESEASTSREDPLAFNFNARCFFCNTDASDSFIKKLYGWPPNKRRTVQIVAKPATKDRIMEHATNNGRSEHRVIADRIENVDLVEVKARYHKKCLEKFYLTKSKSHIKGRPVKEDLIKILSFIVDYISSTPDETQYSLKALMKKYRGPVRPCITVVRKRIDMFAGNAMTLRASVRGDCDLLLTGSREQFGINWQRHLEIIKRAS